MSEQAQEFSPEAKKRIDELEADLKQQKENVVRLQQILTETALQLEALGQAAIEVLDAETANAIRGGSARRNLKRAVEPLLRQADQTT